jgi:hypothetical protein
MHAGGDPGHDDAGMPKHKRMQAAILEWQHKPDKTPTGNMICHLYRKF